jgi:hypothetical protein
MSAFSADIFFIKDRTHDRNIKLLLPAPSPTIQNFHLTTAGKGRSFISTAGTMAAVSGVT